MKTLSFAFITAATVLATAPAAAQEQCYDFSGLPLGTKYHIGDTVNANHATITFRPYKMSGNPVGGEVNFAESQQAQIAGGSAPEMGMKTLTMQIVPNQPVTRLRMRLAQNMTPTGGFGTANFEVNGDKHESPSGFAAVNGKRLGGAEFRASFANNSGNWHVGTLEVRAKPGGAIKSISVGGHTWRADNICLERGTP